MDETSDKSLLEDPETANGGLVSYVMDLVSRWRKTRDANYQEDWNKYNAIYTGKWDAALKNKQVERSKIITPATMDAVDQTVAEMAEAVWGRGEWFVLSDDHSEQEQTIAEQIRQNLIEDFARDGVKDDVIEANYNGAIYGTGIAKRVISKGDDKQVAPGNDGEMRSTSKPYVSIKWEAIPPYNFVIDTAACTIEEAHGCAHETIRPLYEITDKQRTKEYLAGDVSTVSGYGASNALGLAQGGVLQIDSTDGVYITEYHGLVPAHLLKADDPNANHPDKSLFIDEGVTDDDNLYVECIVTIGNGSTLLKAEKNQILNEDRGVIAYQHHRRSKKFWGAGAVEKAFNSQAALDSEVRARIDSLGLLTYPVVGVDATRLNKNLNLAVSPGKVYMTNGNPAEVIVPLKFGNLDPISFQQSGDFERMVQVATGQGASATPVNVNRNNPTATGQSMQVGSQIKRAKLTMQAFDSRFLDPLVKKTLLAYMTLDPTRYPKLVNFTVNSTMSIMAREFEQIQMTNLLAVVPQESPAYNIILKGIVENYSGPSKDKIVEAIDKLNTPDPAQAKMQDQMQQLALQKAQAEVAKLQGEVQELQARANLTNVKSKTEVVKTQHEGQQLEISAAQTVIQNKHADAAVATAHSHAKKVHIDSAIAVHGQHIAEAQHALDRQSTAQDHEVALKVANKPAPKAAK